MNHYNKPNRRGFLKKILGVGTIVGLWGIDKMVNSEPDATEYKIKDWYTMEIKPDAPDKTIYNEYTAHAISGISWDEYLNIVYAQKENREKIEKMGKLEGPSKFPIFEVNDEGEK